MTKEESLQILDNCLKQLEAIPEDELFDYFYERSPSFREAIDKIENRAAKIEQFKIKYSGVCHLTDEELKERHKRMEKDRKEIEDLKVFNKTKKEK